MKILVEGLVDIFYNVFHENKTKDIRLLDANGFCQLMLEVSVQFYCHTSPIYVKWFSKSTQYPIFCVICLQLEYFETVLHAYFSSEAQQALKSFQENLLEKACESLAEALENPGHQRRPTRGSEDAASDGQASVSPDDLLVSARKDPASGLLTLLVCKLMIDVKYICQGSVTLNLRQLSATSGNVLSFLTKDHV